MNYVLPVVHKLPFWQWLFYPSTLSATLGWPLLVLALASILSSRWWHDRESAVIMLSWMVACWLTMGSIRHQETRYICYWLPAFVYFATRLLILPGAKKQVCVLAAVLAVVLLSFTFRRHGLTGATSSRATPRPPGKSLIAGIMAWI